ncbi:hypothetical protein BaRGS_00001679 [Batillaria attramentaria]|uniref:Uncharacterized protein n=1 Tax=Batillaria attramentaria TaxID=370345 RepID=A0ABD0M510_9CAEN
MNVIECDGWNVTERNQRVMALPEEYPTQETGETEMDYDVHGPPNGGQGAANAGLPPCVREAASHNANGGEHGVSPASSE